MGRLTTYKNKIFIAVLCFNMIGFAQIKRDQISIESEVFKKEKSELIINSNLLLAGESLLYKVYNYDDSKELSSLSKTLYISLRNEKDSIIFNHKLSLKNGMGNGSLFIPANVKTGVYKLISYTIFSLNNEDHAFSQENIYIINPFSKSHTNIPPKANNSNIVELYLNQESVSNTIVSTKNENITIQTDKATYGKREKINLSISNLKKEVVSGNYSLSVRKVSSISVSDSISKNEKFAIDNTETFYIPEVRGEIISGKITTTDSNFKISNKQIALSTQGENYLFKTAVTNEDGQFFISIDEPYETNNCTIQLLGTDQEKYSITIHDKSPKFKLKETAPKVYLNPNIKDYLQERSIQIQLQNAYFDAEKNFAEEKLPYESFYGGMGIKYILDDYTRFSTFKETCIEIVTMIKTKENNDSVTLEVFDPFSGYKESTFRSSKPLILMDGAILQDPMVLYSFNTKSIESIQIFPRPYRYGASIFQGIIDVKTKKGDFKPNLYEITSAEFKLESLIEKSTSYVPSYSDDSLDRIPDYRVQLYWEAAIELSSKEILKEFYSSDVNGKYEVVLEGYSFKGAYIEAKYHFNVE